MIVLVDEKYKAVPGKPWRIYAIDYSEDVAALPGTDEISPLSVAVCPNNMRFILSPSNVWEFDASTYSGSLDLAGTLDHIAYITEGAGTNLAVAIGATPVADGGTVQNGDSLTVTFSADTGYENLACTINGVSYDADDSPVTYVVGVGSNVHIATSSTAVLYDLTATVGEHTTLTIVDAAGKSYAPGGKVPHDAVLTITAAAEKGYDLTTFTVNTVDKTSGNPDSHTVSGDVAIVTAATIKSYTLTLMQGEHTTLTVLDGDTPVTTGASVEHGTVLSVTAAADDGYDLTTFTIDGEPATSPATHTMEKAITIVTSATKQEQE